MRIKFWMVLACVLLALGALTGCFWFSLPPNVNEGTAELAPGDPDVEAFSLDTRGLSRVSETIVIGRVLNVTSLQETTPEGSLIFTDAEIDVQETLKGECSKKVIVRTLGGQAGDLVMVVSHEPHFRVGETVVLFLAPSPFGQGRYGVCGAVRGKMTVVDGKILEMPLTLEELVGRITRALNSQDIGPDPYFIPLDEEYSSVPMGEMAPLAYRFDDVRWPGDFVNVKYYINASDPWVSPITASAATWNAVGSKLVFQYAGKITRKGGIRDGYNVIDATRNYGPGWLAQTILWFDSRGTNGGYYYDLVECDTQVNLYYRWFIGSDPSGFDAQNVLTHEFGHWISLGDLYRPKWSELTMYGYISYGETKKRTLEKSDKDGILAVYGAR